MIDKTNVILFLIIIGFNLQNFRLTEMIKRTQRQNQDLRKRLITLENYTFGTHTEDDVWEDNYGK